MCRLVTNNFLLVSRSQGKVRINMSDKENEEVEVDEIFGELLANLVRQYPCLYDKKCKEYKDKKYIADTWTSIAIDCDMSGK